MMAVTVTIAVLLSTFASCAPPAPEEADEAPVEVPAEVEEEITEEEAVEDEVVEPSPEQDEGPVSGGTLAVAIRIETRTLDPVFATGWPFTVSGSHIFDALLYVDQEGVRHPALAESWEVSDDATEYIFHLRKDVTFHDGTPFDAEAVQFHLERVKDPAWCCGNAYQYVGPYESSELLDQYTIKINFTEPWGPFMDYAGDAYTMSIASPAAVEQMGRDFASHGVGTGPFRFVEWVPQDQLVLERNPDYRWAPQAFENQGAPYLDQVVFKFISEPATRLACLESGECNVIKDPAEPDFQRIREDPRLKLVQVPQKGSPLTWVFNTTRFPTDDIAVRKALNLALDREMIAQSVFRGERDPFYSPLTEHTPAFWSGATDYIYFDPDEAGAVLEEAGWVDTDGDGIREKDGRELELDFHVMGAAEANPSVTIAEIAQANFREIGARVNIIVEPWENQSVVAMEKRHNLLQYNMPLPNPNVLSVLFHSREAPAEDHYGMGFSFFHESNPEKAEELDRLFDEAPITADEQERERFYEDAQKIIVENYLSLPIAKGYETYAASVDVHDIKFDVAVVPSFHDTWIER